MSQTTTTAPSINEVNAALLAQYKAAQEAKNTASSPSATGEGSFASTLSAVEKTELPAPTPLVGAKTAVTAEAPDDGKQVTKEELLKEEAASCDSPEISRSARMECAKKATEVQESDLGFDDLVDFINPLQHIPIIGSIYRAVTGDAIKPEVQVAGSIAFGLATGSVLASAATGIASAAYEESTGTEPTIQLADALTGGQTVNVPDPVNEKKVVVADKDVVDATRKATGNTRAAATVASTHTAAAHTASTVPTTHAASTTAVSSAALASTGGMRIGNTVYTSPVMQRAAKVPASTQTATQTAGRSSSQPVPPELVHDMMLMALDKYQTAAATNAQSSAGISTVQ